ncbi:3-isopropylmalate dehydratase small subunit [Novosphingobium sp. FSY-8]|uniref:3-isopropylmalate dehydratase n=1 Tax=Novosphingobium ovatum TaxID=1908523 RepID=A0ABW9XBS6_9SPHN|nr:3-isopropylmalate dehydratase small subunit [Novosphingobium ovatum]NBC35984.1 3-isopropylmalate dehydratase small subunit [Novosphingobium ovatum]
MSAQAFTTLSGPAIPMAEDNIDTDIIFPARFLLLTNKAGLGKYAFHDRRYTADGAEVPDYVMNREGWREAPFIVAGANFGSGSSREQAVWAIHGAGVRCVIAPGFGEIFHANCQRNGILPITLPAEQMADVMAAAQAGTGFAVDLETQTLTMGNAAAPIHFDIAPGAKLALLNGWDETAVVLNQYGADITAFERAQRATQPWLYPEDTAA